MPAREDMFRGPGIGRRRRAGQAYGMEDHDAVIGQALGAQVEEGIIIAQADVFEHADRDDAVELALDVAIVLEIEGDLVVESGGCGPRPRPGDLLGRERNAGDMAGAGDPRQIERQSAPSAAYVQNACVGGYPQFGREVALFVQLGLGQTLVVVFKIGAGILPVGIEKQRIQRVTQIVVMRHIAAGAFRRVGGLATGQP